ncbi:MAG: hypothetical protein HY646_21115 [Acidobacteria bacterium]|nr:hypothetical protein [Acidobacteriota bacterium]
MTSGLFRKIEHTTLQFPELQGYTLTVGLVVNARVHGSAEAASMVIRLNTRERSGMTYFTIAHELTHLLQKPGLGTVPNGEVQCDIFTLARSALFTDDLPTYLPGLRCGKREWRYHATAIRHLCVEAVELRKTRRTYIAWLTEAIEEYFSRAPSPVFSQTQMLPGC